jgi:hypothetical protein
MALKKLLSRILPLRRDTTVAEATDSHASPSLASKVEKIFQPQLPPVFAVISWGYAATGWLSKVLNGHPEILCVHGLNHSQARYISSSQPFEEAHYLKLVRDIGIGYALAGDVHGITAVDHLPALLREFNEAFRFAILVRDPERRVLSFVGIFEQYDYDERVWPGLEYVQQLPGFPLVARYYADKKKRFFMHAANMLNKVREEKNYGPIVRAEDLTTKPEALVDLVSHLSGGRLVPSFDWARAMISLPRINRHRSSSGHDGVADWQADILRALVAPESCRVYEELGYRLSEKWSTAHLCTAGARASA